MVFDDEAEVDPIGPQNDETNQNSHSVVHVLRGYLVVLNTQQT